MIELIIYELNGIEVVGIILLCVFVGFMTGRNCYKDANCVKGEQDG